MDECFLVSSVSWVLTVVKEQAATFTVIGVILVFFQLRKQASTAAADFVLRLDERIGTHRHIYEKLMEEGDWYCIEELTGNEKIEMEYYITFYHTLFQLIDRKMLSMARVDRMFGYRFLIAMHNPTVKKLLHEKSDYWLDLRPLYDGIVHRRTRAGSSIPRLDHRWDDSFLNR